MWSGYRDKDETRFGVSLLFHLFFTIVHWFSANAFLLLGLRDGVIDSPG